MKRGVRNLSSARQDISLLKRVACGEFRLDHSPNARPRLENGQLIESSAPRKPLSLDLSEPLSKSNARARSQSIDIFEGKKTSPLARMQEGSRCSLNISSGDPDPSDENLRHLRSRIRSQLRSSGTKKIFLEELLQLFGSQCPLPGEISTFD